MNPHYTPLDSRLIEACGGVKFGGGPPEAAGCDSGSAWTATAALSTSRGHAFDADVEELSARKHGKRREQAGGVAAFIQPPDGLFSVSASPTT